MQVILLSLAAVMRDAFGMVGMKLPLMCGGSDKDYIAIANYLHFRAAWLRCAELCLLYAGHRLVSKVINHAVVDGVLGNGKGYLKVFR